MISWKIRLLVAVDLEVQNSLQKFKLTLTNCKYMFIIKQYIDDRGAESMSTSSRMESTTRRKGLPPKFNNSRIV